MLFNVAQGFVLLWKRNDEIIAVGSNIIHNVRDCELAPTSFIMKEIDSSQ